MKQMLNAAIALAAKHHDGQYDKAGEPYILHCLKVFHYIKSTDEELNCIAVLHDIIEDTKCTYAELRSEGMSERVIDGVRCLTKVPGETYDEYREKVMSNEDAMVVKSDGDLRHNMDIRRLKGVTQKDMQRIEKYAKFFQEIKKRQAEIAADISFIGR